MVRIPPPIWMFLFLAIAGAVSHFQSWEPVAHWRFLGTLLVAAGLVLGFSAFRLFRVEDTELNPASESNRKLVVRGPFRLTRNPMYLSLLLISLGIAFWVGTPPMFAVPLLVFAITNWVHIPFEEDKMRRQFGTAFDDYANRVRRWL
jgi:protein-S-isoprenylcysteine O-methyltransferase Ste14